MAAHKYSRKRPRLILVGVILFTLLTGTIMLHLSRADTATITVNDNTIGTGVQQWQYTGNWQYYNDSPAKYGNDDHGSAATGDTAVLRFSGTQVRYYGAKFQYNGVAAVSIDGGSETSIDLYAATRADNTLLYTSPTLPDGVHTLTIRVTGTNGAGGGHGVSVDRADVITTTSTGGLKYVTSEPETGNLSPEVAIVSDTAASGNGAVRFKAPTSSGRTVKIMPLGDSITASSGLAGGWRYPLWQKLVQDGAKIDFVGSQTDTGPANFTEREHEGHSGWCIDVCNGSSAVNSITGWMNTYQPDVVMVHFGTNDIYQSTSGAVTTTRMDTLLSKIYAAKPDSYVILSKIINNTMLTTAQRANQQAYWDSIPGLVSKYQGQGRKIVSVDLSTTLSAGDYGDGIHPNESGMAKMANAYYPVVSQVYKTY